jgi:drug/metabolite transporter (DMT)-like permease
MTTPTSASPATPDAVPSSSLLIYLKLVIVALCWGGTFIAGHVVAAAMPPMLAAACRFVVAVLMMFAVVWKSEGRIPRLTRQQFLQTVALGLTGIFA